MIPKSGNRFSEKIMRQEKSYIALPMPRMRRASMLMM